MDRFSIGLSENFIKKIKYFFMFKSIYDEFANKLIITEEDFVYAVGFNSYGILGLGHNNNVSEPTIIPELCNKQIIEFNNSLEHCIAKSIDGKIYSFGSNNFNQLGYKAENEGYYRPKLIENLLEENVIEVSCGASHTIVLTKNEEVFGWGKNSWGQIGINTTIETEPIPMQIKGFNNEKIQSVSCGSTFSMALTVSGNVFSWGDNSMGQLGNNSRVDSITPQRLEIKDVLFMKISCGDEHSLVLSTKGDIYSFGVNNKNELGYETSDCYQCIPQIIKMNTRIKFSHICCVWDQNFSMALSSDDNKCYVWGECETKNVIKLPEVRLFNSIEELLLNNFGITIKTIKNPLKVFQTFIKVNYYELNFKHIEYISEGDYGKVFKVFDKKTKTFDAIKRLDFSANYAYTENVLREIQFVSRLKSELVIEYKDSWIEKNIHSEVSLNQYFLFIQMELCLQTYKDFTQNFFNELNHFNELCDAYIGLYFVLEIMKEVIEGVNFLHNNKIIHRDLKPNNILITEFKNGRIVKIADFGISCIHETIFMNNTFESVSHTGDVGDPKFQAPELQGMYGRLAYNEKVDVYSLGIIFGELFEKLKIYLKHLSKYSPQYISIKNKYEKLYELINRMIHLNADQRPSCNSLLLNLNDYFIDLMDTIDVDYVSNFNFKRPSILFNYIGKKLIFGIINTNNSGNKSIRNPNFAVSLLSLMVDERILELDHGQNHCIARSINGKLYSFGDNNHKQLGYETEVKETNIPKHIELLNNENVVQIKCGQFHTIVLTRDKILFGWGDNSCGQIGIKRKGKFNSLFKQNIGEFHSIPVLIEGISCEKVKSISCGMLHSMALTDNGKVFSWGSNLYGQLGRYNSTVHSFVPKMIYMNDEKVFFKQISCGDLHSLLLSANGDIYSFENNSYHQLGHYICKEHQIIPRLIEMKPRIEFSDICCIWTNDTSAALSSADSICFIWGRYRNTFIAPQKTHLKSFEKIRICKDRELNLITEMTECLSEREANILKNAVYVSEHGRNHN